MKRRGTGIVMITVVLTVLVCGWMNGKAYGQTGLDEGTGAGDILCITRKLEPEEAQNPVKPGDTYWDKDGNKFGLERYEVREIPGHRTSAAMEKQVVYENVEGAEGIPKSISVREEHSGEMAEGELFIRDARMTGEKWKDGFTAPVMFHSYGADEYEAGAVVIDSKDVLSGAVAAQEELLGVMGLLPEEYRIVDMEWSGEPFLDEEGQLCRQATARGRKLVRDYEVIYGGEVSYMEPASYELEMVYRPVRPLPAAGTDENPGHSDETFGAAAPSEPERGPLWYWVRSGFVLTVGAGLVGVAAGIIILTVLWLKQKRKERRKFLNYSGNIKKKDIAL